MGGRPIVAINLMSWPRGVLPAELMSEVLAGGLAIGKEAGCPVIGGHTVDEPEPKDGMAVTGVAEADQLLRNDAAQSGLPLTLTKPLGLGLLNNRHKATGEVFEEAVATMTTLNKEAGEQAVAADIKAATDVTGFRPLRNLYKMRRDSGTGAVRERQAGRRVDAAARRHARG